jgi:hypothetical protein
MKRTPAKTRIGRSTAKSNRRDMRRFARLPDVAREEIAHRERQPFLARPWRRATGILQKRKEAPRYRAIVARRVSQRLSPKHFGAFQ